ncbi:MAG: hypothetical protein U0610_24200 [bacterium]
MSRFRTFRSLRRRGPAWAGVWVGLCMLLGQPRGAFADGGDSGPVRVVFSFDDTLDGWVLGGKHPTYSARIVHEPEAWKTGGGAAEIRYSAGEQVLFGTDTLNQGPPPGLLQRIFGGQPPPRARLVNVSDMAGFAFDLKSDVATMLFVNVVERGGARYVHPFEVAAGAWQAIRIPLAAFTVAADSSDSNGHLDAGEIYAIALGDLRSFTTGDSAANRILVDSFGVWAAPGEAAPTLAGGDAPGSGERLRVRASGGALVARVGEEVEILGAESIPAGGSLELAGTDASRGAVSAGAGPRAAPAVPGLYRVASRGRAAAGSVGAMGADTLAVVPPGRPASWLGTCVVSELSSTEHAGADPTFVHAAGIHWDRPIVSWRGIERSPGQDDWAETDRLIDERVGQGLALAPMLAHAPTWAGSDASGDAAPTDLAALAAFAERLVARYRDRVRFWTLGNEPNWAHTKMSAATYVGLLEAFARGARRADPEVKVMLAGIAFIDLEYLEKLYVAGAGAHFDIMNLHPYAFPAAPEEEQGSALLRRTTGVEASLVGVKKVRALMERYGDGAKPIWITEISWGSGRDATDLEAKYRPFMVDPMTQARYYVRGALLARAWGVERFFLLSVQDLPDAAAQLFARSGVVGLDGTPKPALVALAVLARQVGEARVAGEIGGLPAPARGVLFEAQGERIAVLWTTSGQVLVPTRAIGVPRAAVDFFGRPIDTLVTESASGEGAVSVDENPRYIRVSAP